MKREMALFRFSLIAPVVADTYQQVSKMEYYRQTSEPAYLLPNGRNVKFAPLTLKKWYQKYTAGGLEALIPHARMDLGQSRALSEDVCRQIHAYREQFPYITGKKIYEKLIEQGYLKKEDASVDSVYRYLKAADLTRTSMSPQECLAFEFEHANDCWQADTTVGPTIDLLYFLCTDADVSNSSFSKFAFYILHEIFFKLFIIHCVITSLFCV